MEKTPLKSTTTDHLGLYFIVLFNKTPEIFLSKPRERIFTAVGWNNIFHRQYK